MLVKLMSHELNTQRTYLYTSTGFSVTNVFEMNGNHLPLKSAKEYKVASQTP